MTDLDNAAAVAAAREGTNGVETTVSPEVAPEAGADPQRASMPWQVMTCPVAELGGQSLWGVLNTVMPEVIAEFLSSLVVPLCRKLLRPTLVVIDHSAADHATESLALQAFPETLANVLLSAGADHLLILLGAHLISSAVKDAHGGEDAAIPPVMEPVAVETAPPPAESLPISLPEVVAVAEPTPIAPLPEGVPEVAGL